MKVIFYVVPIVISALCTTALDVPFYEPAPVPPHWDDDPMERMYSIAMGETIVKLPPSIRGSHPLPAENQAKSPEEVKKMWLDALVLY